MAFDKETKYEAHVMKHQFLSNKYNQRNTTITKQNYHHKLS